VASSPPFSAYPDRPGAEIEDHPGKARHETLKKAPKATFVADGWTSAGVYAGQVWASKLLSFPATLKPEDLVGLIVTPTNLPNYLRADPPRGAGGRGREIGVIGVGDQIEIGEVHTVPSTTSGLSVWVAVRRLVR
jgi:hypothetical protein